MTENRAIQPINSTKLAHFKDYARSAEIIQRFTEVLGNQNAMAFVSSVILAVAENTSLQECTPQSIMTAAMRAANLRLSCDPSIKQAYLVPFKGKATFILGWKGIQDMAIRTGRYRYLNVFPVYEGTEVIEDPFKGIHRLEGGRTSDRVIGYMLAFELISGYAKTFYMTWDEIMAHGKKYSRSFDDPRSPWKTETQKMARKTVLRMGLTQYGYFDPFDQMILSEEEQVIEEDATLPEPEDVQYLGDFVEEEDTPGPVVRQQILDNLGF